jgi:hypothetical protein
MGFTATGFASSGTKTVVNIAAFKALLVAMSTRARSKTELHELTGLTNTTISRWIRVLSTGPDRLVYIERYQLLGKAGNHTAFWRAGHNMPDAIKPRAKTSSEYNKAARKRALHAAAVKTVQTPTGLIHTSKIVRAPR